MEIEEKIKWLIATDEGLSFSFSSPFELTGPPILVLAILTVLLLSIIWVYKDAKRIGKNPLLAVVFLVFSAWPFSICWWNWLKPQKPINKEKNL